MFPSYKSVRKDLIFEPTADEKLAFEKDNECDGVDRKGKHYLEFQDSLGDIKNGDRGFLMFAFEPNTVADFFSFRKGEKEEGTGEKVSMREKKAKKDPNKPKRALDCLI
ncbi:unnamed protein product, partial [Brassica napus]